jgi:type II secretory pathway pseudopilin PulG
MSGQSIGKSMNSRKHSQSGQSLIETIVAIFILVTALVAGLSLALYAVSSSANNKNQIVASNLAREGIEVVRMMRDSNWLMAEDDANIEDLQNCTYPLPAPNDVHPCYPEAFGVSQGLGDQFSLRSSDWYFNYLTMFNNGDWQINASFLGITTFFLCQQADGRFEHVSSALSCPANPIRYARRVSIKTGSTASPYTSDSDTPTAASGHSPEKVVTATVVWMGRGCTVFPTDFFGILLFDPEGFNTRCKITITERLTNWKDYQ